MFAIVKIGSTQYKISGDFIQVGRLKEEEGKALPDKVCSLRTVILSRSAAVSDGC